LNVYVSPELVFRITDEEGRTRLGAVKIHCGKNNSFTNNTATLASVILFKYLRLIAQPEDTVDSEYCFIVDIFGERIVTTPSDIGEYWRIIDNLCSEIVKSWDAA
jgi:hypothetical protein